MAGLPGKMVVLGVTGGIAAYKAAELCRLLIKAGAVVRVVMTEAATRFIGTLTMQTLAGTPVARDLLAADEEARIGHIRLGDEADLILVAPATATSIARFAGGLADDLLAAVVLSSRAPVLLAPAMNVNMWQNPITQKNLGTLIGTGRFQTVGPDAGELACGWIGEGRLIEPSEIVAAANKILSRQDLAGRHIVITAGPTFEPIDDVRFVGNRSSGKMGFAMAAAAAARGATVTLIAGPVALDTPGGGGITRKDVETAAEMGALLDVLAPQADVVVMAAAVADFRPATRVAGKISRRATDASVAPSGQDGPPVAWSMVPNPDLLAQLAARRHGRAPLLVGFAAEVAPSREELLARARAKLVEKKCDVVVGNDIGTPGAGFGTDENEVVVAFADGASMALARAPKIGIADGIWDALVDRLPEPRSENTTTKDVPAVRGGVTPLRHAAVDRRAIGRGSSPGPLGGRGRRG